MNRAKKHQKLLDSAMWKLQKHFGKDIMVFKRVVGKFKMKNNGIISCGIQGQADLYGFLKSKNHAMPFEIEIKTGDAVLTKEQESWKKLCKRIKVFYFVLRENNLPRLIEKLEMKKVF